MTDQVNVSDYTGTWNVSGKGTEEAPYAMTPQTDEDHVLKSINRVSQGIVKILEGIGINPTQDEFSSAFLALYHDARNTLNALKFARS